MPALPLHEAGKYVAGAYLVFLVLLLVYVAIMSSRLARIASGGSGEAVARKSVGGTA